MTTRSLEPHALHFRTPSRLAVVRDVLLVALWLALTVGFLAEVWHGPVPAGRHSTEQAGAPQTVTAPTSRG